MKYLAFFDYVVAGVIKFFPSSKTNSTMTFWKELLKLMKHWFCRLIKEPILTELNPENVVVKLISEVYLTNNKVFLSPLIVTKMLCPVSMEPVESPVRTSNPF